MTVLGLLAFAGDSIQLVPDGTLLFHLALIVLMVALLNATLLKPINQILERRERETKGQLNEAQTVLATVETKMREHESRLREARTRGYMLLEEERAAASRERERGVADVKASVTLSLDEQKRKLRSDEAQARESLAKETRARASEIGERILGRRV